MSQQPCPSREILADFATGRLDLAGIEDVSRHLEDCQPCAKTLSTLQLNDTLLGVIQQRPTNNQTDDPAIHELLSRVQSLAGTRDTEYEDAPLSERLTCLRPAELPDELGRLGCYRILQVIGVGGMGTVFLAEHLEHHRTVALKVMRPGLSESASGRKRFLREIQALAAQDHSAIVPVLDVGEDNGVPFFAMPLLRGETLESRLKSEDRLPVMEALRIAREIALGLAAAHERGVVHRDVKPANVFLCQLESVIPTSGPTTTPAPTTQVKLMDFGLARNVEQKSWQTQAGTVLGTPHYMAPEQIEGRDLDARADLFSLGCVLFRMTTGTLPFTGPSHMSVFVSVTRDTPPNVRHMNPAVPPALAELIEQLLEKQPDRRPRSAAEVAERLNAIGYDSRDVAKWNSATPIVASASDDGTVTVITRERFWFAKASRRTVLVGLVLAVTILLGVLIVFQTQRGRLEIELAAGAVSEIQIEIVQAETVHLLNALNGWSIEVPPGQWDARLSGDTDHFQLEQDSIRVTRGETSRLRVTRRRTNEVAAAVKANDPVPAREQPPARNDAPKWQPGPTENVLYGLIPRPAAIPGIKSWQLETHNLRGMSNGVQWSPDGTLLALQNGCQLRVYKPEGKELKLFRIFSESVPGPVYGFAWSPDSQWLAMNAGYHNQNPPTRLWNVRDGKPGKLIQADISRKFLAWSPDGKWLAVGQHSFERGDVRIFAIDGLVPSRVFGTHPGTASIAWSPDSETVITGHHDKTARLWNLDGTPGPILEGHQYAVEAVSWSPDGKWIATGGYGPVRIWNTSGELTRTLDGPHGIVKNVLWSPDSRGLTVAADNVCSWDDVSDPKMTTVIPTAANLPKYGSWRPGTDELVLLALHSSTVWFHDIGDKTTRLTMTPQRAVTSATSSPDGARVAFATTDGQVRSRGTNGEWQVVTEHRRVGGKPLPPMFEQAWFANSVNLGWSASGRFVSSTVVEHVDPYVRLWNTEDNEPGQRFLLPTTDVSWSPHEDQLVFSREGLQKFDLETEQSTRFLDLKDIASWSLSPDGKQVALVRASTPNAIEILSVADGTTLGRLEVSEGSPIGGIRCWSPDGQYLLSGTSPLTLWRVRDQRRVWTVSLTGEWGELTRLQTGPWFAVSPDGSRILIHSGLLDAETGQYLHKFPISVFSVSWFPDGRRFLAVGDGVVLIGDAETLQTLETIIPIGKQHALSFDAAGNLTQGDPALLEQDFVCLIERDDGTLVIMKPLEFLRQHAGLTSWPTARGILGVNRSEAAPER